LGGTDKPFHDLHKLLKGSQGVGLKATVFTSQFFQIETHSGGKQWARRVEGCWRYMEPDFDDQVTDPQLQDSLLPGSGTTVTYSLHDYSVKEFLQEVISEYCGELNLTEVSSEQELLHLLELYFRTKTYLGCVQALLGFGTNLKPIRVRLRVCLDSPTIEEHGENQIAACAFLSSAAYHGRVLEHTFPAVYTDSLETHSALPRSQQVDRVYENIAEVIATAPNPNMKKFLAQKLSMPQVQELLLAKIKRDPSTGEFQLVPDPDARRKHQRLLDKLNGVYLVVGPRPYLAKYLHLSPKQFISVNGSPTNIGLNPPRGAGELGYLLNIHLIIDLDITLGYGKRNLPSVVKGQADAFFADIFNILRRVAKAVVGEREAREPQTKVWRKDKEYEDYVRPSNPFRDWDLPIRVVPIEEQEVVCLFHELIARGTLRGYYPFRASTNGTYDALMYISRSTNGTMPRQIPWSDLSTVEFKLNLSALIQDFVEERKYLRDIDLAVVWTDDYEGETEYVVSSLERDGIDPLPGAQKRIRLGTQSCQIIVLRDWLIETGLMQVDDSVNPPAS